MIQNSRREAETDRVAQCIVSAALEKLATNLASYLAAGVHEPADNGRGAVILFLEALADAAVDPKISEDYDRDEALHLALDRLGQIIMRIRAAARL